MPVKSPYYDYTYGTSEIKDILWARNPPDIKNTLFPPQKDN